MEEVADMVEKLLKAKAELLLECVGVEIDGQGCLTALPAIIDHYVPDLNRLPSLVIRLAQDVDWSDEKCCFSSLAQVRPAFAPSSIFLPPSSAPLFSATLLER